METKESAVCDVSPSNPALDALRDKKAADFFAGIGLVRMGLEQEGWHCVYANDHDEKKRRMYQAHFGDASDHYDIRDIMQVAENPDDVPTVGLAHASFPCTDLSHAGGRAGLDGEQSSAIWDFLVLLERMEGRRPPLVTLENVDGFVSSNGGKDLAGTLEKMNDLGYALDLLRIDARHFVPQSRSRVFVVGRMNGKIQNEIRQEQILSRSKEERSTKILEFIRGHSEIQWKLRDLPHLPKTHLTVADVVQEGREWWDEDRSQYLYDQMFDRHQKKVQDMMEGDEYSYGTVFRRMRKRDGKRRSTAELRTDGVAGCLRTPKGGSAKQILVRAGKGEYDARLISPVEYARLMGADDYDIGEDLSRDAAFFGFADGVCVPAVRWLAQHYLNPVAAEIIHGHEANQRESMGG